MQPSGQHGGRPIRRRIGRNQLADLVREVEPLVYRKADAVVLQPGQKPVQRGFGGVARHVCPACQGRGGVVEGGIHPRRLRQGNRIAHRFRRAVLRGETFDNALPESNPLRLIKAALVGLVHHVKRLPARQSRRPARFHHQFPPRPAQLLAPAPDKHHGGLVHGQAAVQQGVALPDNGGGG